MDKTEYLEFSSREKAQIFEVEREIKATKLWSFFIELLANNELEYVNKLVNKEVSFYEELNTLEILNKSIEDMSNSIFRDWVVSGIENIRKIEDEKYNYLKDIFIEKIIKNLKEIENKQFTPDQLNGSPFHKRTLELGLELLIENIQYVENFKSINLEEYNKVINVIELSNKLPIKNISDKKPKI